MVLLLPVGRDIRLLRHWLEHYAGFGFDRILISVHVRPEWSPTLVEDVRRAAAAYGGIVADVHSAVFSNLKERRERLIAAYCQPQDWVFMADMDEFHEYPSPPRDLVAMCERLGFDYVMGRLLDRVGPDGTFPDLDDRPLWDQFPVGLNLTETLIGGTPAKVVFARASVRIVEGQHQAVTGVGCPEDGLNIVVHHFKWDASVVERTRYMAWKNALEGNWYFLQQRRFLKFIEAHGRIPLDDPRLTVSRPPYRRSNPGSAEATPPPLCHPPTPDTGNACQRRFQ